MVRRRFSQREGVIPSKDIQINSLDVETRNRLWNVISKYYFRRLLDDNFDINKREYLRWRALLENVWDKLFGESLDFLYENEPKEIFEYLREYIISSEWFEVYDLIEFVSQSFVSDRHNEIFRRECNSILEEESSGYRFIGGLISGITSEEEIAEVEEVLETSFDPIKDHISRALEHLSDRRTPDYRNSIKESISAVESACKIITGNRRATLGQALSRLEEIGVDIHDALRRAFSSIYGWTSDEDGIRHAIIDEDRADFDYAKFMLVICSAFVNFLMSKARAAGINLEENLARIRGS